MVKLIGVSGVLGVVGLVAKVERLPILPQPNRGVDVDAGDGGSSMAGLMIPLLPKQFTPTPAANVKD
jgi:hypothetical protein